MHLEACQSQYLQIANSCRTLLPQIQDDSSVQVASQIPECGTYLLKIAHLSKKAPLPPSSLKLPNPKPQTLNPKPLNPKPQTLNPKLLHPHPKPNPKP